MKIYFAGEPYAHKEENLYRIGGAKALLFF